MGRDVTCKISLLRATSSLALGKMKWLSHGETRPENCSQLLSLTVTLWEGGDAPC